MTGLLPPRESTILLGHDAAEQMLQQAAQAGRMHHAWLISGKPGIGKATLAYRFARWLLAGRPHGTINGATLALDPQHKVFRRVAMGTHADLLTVERAWDESLKRSRREIVVDDVRAVGSFLRLTPAEGGWRVVIVDGAETLNRNAANALLKVLEEPPPRAILLLVCDAPGRLPATLRSRCRHLPLPTLAPDVVSTLLEMAQPNRAASERERLVALAEGSIGRALQLAEGDGVAIAELVSEVLGALPSVSVARAHNVADALGRNDSGFATFLELTRSAIAAALGHTLRGTAEPAQIKLAALRPLAEWCDVWHALGRLHDETERFYLDKRQAVVSGIALLRGT
jgi:DNA polymerase-3 subunit delta'